MAKDGKRKGCGRIVGGLFSLALAAVIVVMLGLAGLVVEGEVRTGQALDHLSTAVQGPTEGSSAQRKAGFDVTVGLAQMQPAPLDVAANLGTVAEYVDQALQQKCQLLVLPELALTGLELGDGIWDAAEPIDGFALTRLREIAQENNLALATSIVERADDDVFDTAVFINPDGTYVTGRKLHPPLAEAARFARGSGPQVVDTSLGRLGLVLCADAFRADTFENLLDGDPDMVLIMSAAPVLDTQLPGMRVYTPDEWLALAGFYSDRLGVPVVSAHACGAVTMTVPWQPDKPVPATYCGASRIVNKRTRTNVAPTQGQPMFTATTVHVGRLGDQLEAEIFGDYIVPRSILYNTLAGITENQANAFYQANPRP